MIIHFWGVRGSLSAPLSPQQIQSKIMAVVQRITEDDIKSVESRAKFVANLPAWINGTTGGNTACVEVKTDDSKEFIFDAGTGIRVFGKSPNLPQNKQYNMFFSHFHWDHIQGLPFFDPAYDPESKFDVFSPVDDFQNYLKNQMFFPYFPQTFDAFTKNFAFHKIVPGQAISIGDSQISACKMSHPGDSYSYAVLEGNKKFVYATDVELRTKDFAVTAETEAVFKDADVIVLDSQYTVEEAFRKINWGHSAFCYAVDFAINWNIKKLYLFHHEPTYDDKKLNSILMAARWYAQYIHHSDIQIELAREDEEIII
ncbi:MAG: MBL fold metallo-hydrolase [Treponema sp.]|nr:MBL fold metallo-hydrolase [Treponema sp.]